MMARFFLSLALAVMLFGPAVAAEELPTCGPGAELQQLSQLDPAQDGEALVCPAQWAETAPAEEQLAACCKICRKGKACGDSCISKSKTCHKGQGCACDAE